MNSNELSFYLCLKLIYIKVQSKESIYLSVDKNILIAPLTYSTENFCGFSGSLLMAKIWNKKIE